MGQEIDISEYGCEAIIGASSKFSSIGNVNSPHVEQRSVSCGKCGIGTMIIDQGYGNVPTTNTAIQAREFLRGNCKKWQAMVDWAKSQGLHPRNTKAPDDWLH